MDEPPKTIMNRRREALGLLGFLLVATAQVSNMILARGVAGTVPPFTIAFFRWSIVALGLLPAVVIALRANPGPRRSEIPGIAAAGFLGMFICGGPVYMAGVTTSAINLALIMALSPLDRRVLLRRPSDSNISVPYCTAWYSRASAGFRLMSTTV